MNALLLVLALSAAAAPSGFVGRWETTYGSMTLSESSGTLSGTYLMGGAPCDISGRLADGEFVFTYREPNASGEGRFTLAKDGGSFEGSWRQSGSAAWRPWRGERPAPGQEPGFAGLWDTTFGRLRLLPDGDRFLGVYSLADGSLEGTVKDRVMRFRYQDTAAGEGEFALSDDGGSFEGRWRADGEKEWKPWAGARIAPVPGRRWLVVLERRWEASLADHEYSYGEMLKSFFTPSPQVSVRQRFFTDSNSLSKWLREAALLAEPTVVYFSSHGSPAGVAADGGSIGAEPIARALRGASNVLLVHFGACEVMNGSVPEELQRRLSPVRVPISGFAQSVDWAASAIVDFTYLDLILSRGMAPAHASRELARLMPLAPRRSTAAGYDGVSFRFRPAPAASR